MSNYVPFNRDQSFLLPPDLKAWLPEDDLAHFVLAAVERVPLGSFVVAGRTGGKPQYHPRPMLRACVIGHGTTAEVGSSLWLPWANSTIKRPLSTVARSKPAVPVSAHSGRQLTFRFAPKCAAQRTGAEALKPTFMISTLCDARRRC
jgi:hypothetical protein